MKVPKSVIAIIGAAGIAATVAACGQGFRHHDPQEFAAWQVERISRTLELNETQTIKLNAVKDGLLKSREAMQSKREQKRQALLALLEQPTLDRQRALGLVQEFTRDVNSQAPEVIGSVADFYDSLTPAQQQKVRAHVTEHLERGSRYGWHH